MLLKIKSERYKAKKSKTFSTNEIKQFITEAPDVKYLLTKFFKAPRNGTFGNMGACRRNEIPNYK